MQDTDETERVISVDGLLVSHIGIYDLDEVMSHFDIRSRYTDELGRALARVFDQNVYRTIIKTARADSTLAGASSTSPFPDGNQILSADVTGTLASTASGSDWWEAIRKMRVQAGGTNNIPDNDPLWVAMPYDTFDALKYAQVADTASNPFLFTNRDLTFGDQGSAGVTTGLNIDGIEAFRTNLLPQADDSANGDVKAKYRADYTGTLAAGWHRDGVGTVKLIGMGLESTRDVRRQEDFIVSKIAVGHGPVRNEGTWEFRNT